MALLNLILKDNTTICALLYIVFILSLLSSLPTLNCETTETDPLKSITIVEVNEQGELQSPAIKSFKSNEIICQDFEGPGNDFILLKIKLYIICELLFCYCQNCSKSPDDFVFSFCFFLLCLFIDINYTQLVLFCLFCLYSFHRVFMDCVNTIII